MPVLIVLISVSQRPLTTHDLPDLLVIVVVFVVDELSSLWL